MAHTPQLNLSPKRFQGMEWTQSFSHPDGKKSCSTMSAAHTNTPNLLSETRGLSTAREAAVASSHDDKNTVLVLMSTFSINVLE